MWKLFVAILISLISVPALAHHEFSLEAAAEHGLEHMAWLIPLVALIIGFIVAFVKKELTSKDRD